MSGAESSAFRALSTCLSEDYGDRLVYAGESDAIEASLQSAEPGLLVRLSGILDECVGSIGRMTAGATPLFVRLADLGGIETRVRKLVRTRPLEVVKASGSDLVTLSAEGAIRVIAAEIVRSNEAADYVHLATLARLMGHAAAADVLVRLDAFYSEPHRGGDIVATQIVCQLIDPQPARMPQGPSGEVCGTEWHQATAECQKLATEALRASGGAPGVSLAFRNIDVDPSQPVEDWGVEGILTALERGSLAHWRRILDALDGSDAERVASELAEALACTEAQGVRALFELALDAEPGAEAEQSMSNTASTE